MNKINFIAIIVAVLSLCLCLHCLIYYHSSLSKLFAGLGILFSCLSLLGVYRDIISHELEVKNYYPIYITDPDNGSDFFSVQSIKDSNNVCIFLLYGKEVSEEEVLDFFKKHKP